MKTRNIFSIDGSSVNVKIVSGTKADGNEFVLWESDFDAADVPEMLEDGDGFKSLKGYGLASLLQDRAASYADKTLGDSGVPSKDWAGARGERYSDVFNMLLGGKFTDRQAGGAAKGAAVDTFFAQALVEFVEEQGKYLDLGAATQLLSGMDKEARKALRVRLADKIAAAKAEANKTASEFDLGALLG